MKRSHSLFSFGYFLIFFLSGAFIVTCCFLLFFAGTDIPESVIRERAPITFLNVVFIAALFTAFDFFLRKITVERPLKRILSATKSVMEGDFSVRIKPLHGTERFNEFDIIIESINKMAEELCGIETLRTDFIANVSHELKTPLAVIQNYATLLSAPGINDEKRVEYCKAIIETTKRFSNMITNILKLNKLENQNIFPKLQKYELNEQICECMLNFEEQWEKRSLEIKTELDEVVAINGDYELLSLVWNNLLSNAVKFNREGGSITVRLFADGDDAVVKISDTGCGISPETGRHIFEKFYQGDTSHAMGGNGLGLALTKRVLDIVGGEVSVESKVGEGSTFTVKLKR